MKKILFLPVIFLAVLIFPQPTYAWGDGIPGALLKQSMEQVEKGITGTILGAVKTAAVTSIVNQVDRLLGGVGAEQPKIIRNYDDYLRLQPQLEAEAQVYNFLSRTYRSLGSTSNYTSANGSTVGAEGSYETGIESVARGAIKGSEYKYDLNEYCTDPKTSLSQGDLRCLDAWRSNPANNPYGAALRAEREYQRVYDEIRFQRQIQATGTGFLPGVDPKTGQVVTPSGTIAAVYNDAKTLASKIITSAQNPGELVSGVVFALVNRSINTIASKASGLVEDVVDKTVGRAVTEIVAVSGDIGKTLRTVDGYIIDANGYLTEAGYNSEQANKLRQEINSSTPAPPGTVVSSSLSKCFALDGLCIPLGPGGQSQCPASRPRNIVEAGICKGASEYCCVK